MDTQRLFQASHLIHYLLEAVSAKQFVLLSLEVLAERVVLVGGDDSREGRVGPALQARRAARREVAWRPVFFRGDSFASCVLRGGGRR